MLRIPDIDWDPCQQVRENPGPVAGKQQLGAENDQLFARKCGLVVADKVAHDSGDAGTVNRIADDNGLCRGHYLVKIHRFLNRITGRAHYLRKAFGNVL